MKRVTGILLATAGIAAVAMKIKGKVTAVIGGADGPTAFFFAGKIGSGRVFITVGVVIALLAAGICLIGKKK